MSKIQEHLNKINTAVYGIEVRGAIHDSIEECYADVSNAKTIADAATAEATSASEAAANAAANANEKATSAATAAANANSAAADVLSAKEAAVNAAANANEKATSAATAAANANAAAEDAREAASTADEKAALAAEAANTADEKAALAMDAVRSVDESKNAAERAATEATSASEAAVNAAANANEKATSAVNAAANANEKATSAATAAANANAAAEDAVSAREAAIHAAEDANEKAERAVNAAADAHAAALDATTAAANATTAAANATTAAAKAENVIVSVETAIDNAEAAAGDARNGASKATTAATTANSAAANANSAAANANEKATSAATNAANANSAAANANAAAANANEKAESAKTASALASAAVANTEAAIVECNTAAENANEAVKNISQIVETEVAKVTDGIVHAEGFLGYLDPDNTIVLDNADNGEYIVKLEDWNKPIEGYDGIPMSVTDSDKEYKHFINENCAPAGTKRLGIYDNSEAKIGTIRPHGNYRKNGIGSKLYSFGALSDVHYQYDTAADDFARALTYFNEVEKVAFTCISGDLTRNGSKDELNDFMVAVDTYSPNTPVYPATGNHEGVNENIRFVVEQYIGQPLYYKKEYGNDVYLFVGCKSNVTGSLFTKAELQWLYEELELNRNKRCFVFEHVRPEDGCGNALGIYTNDIWGGTEQVVFESLMRHYKNVILFHGHSHLKLYMQEFSDIANYDNLFGCHSVHVPSLAVPRDTTSVVNPSITEIYAASEGYVVDVYDKGIMLRGRDFVAEKFLPIATYWLDTPLHEVPAQTYTDSTGMLDTSVVREIQLAWTMDTGIDRSTGEETAEVYSAVSGPIPVSTTLRYIMSYRDFDGQATLRMFCYAADGSYIGYVTLHCYDYRRCDVIPFIPHEGTAFMRLHVDNSSDRPIDDKLRRITLVSELSSVYTNMIPLSIDTDGSIYNGGKGWKEGYRANSTGGETALSGCRVTGYIPYKKGDIICLSGMDAPTTQRSVHCYDENFNILFYLNLHNTMTSEQHRFVIALDENGYPITLEPYSMNWNMSEFDNDTIRYIRVSGTSMTDATVVTLNQPILWDMENVPITWVQGIKIEEANGAEVSDANYAASEMITLDSDAIYEVFCASSHQLGLGYIWYAADGAFLGCTQSVRKTTAEAQAFSMKEVLEPPKNAVSMKFRISHGGYWSAAQVAEKVTMVKRS